jgi:hypothetical protein
MLKITLTIKADGIPKEVFERRMHNYLSGQWYEDLANAVDHNGDYDNLYLILELGPVTEEATG